MSHIAIWLVVEICVLGLGVRWPLGVGGRGDYCDKRQCIGRHGYGSER